MRRAGCCSLTMLLIVVSSCGGDDTPTTPTMTPPVETPIVVSLTAQIVDNQAIMGVTSITQKRAARVTGSVNVTGGGATIEVALTFTPTGGTVPIEVVALSLRSITPLSPPSDTDFDVRLAFDIVPGANAEGTVRATVTGTTDLGDTVALEELLEPTSDNTRLPPGSCVEDSETLCLLDGGRFRATVDWEDFDGNMGQGTVTPGQRFEDGGWFSIAALSGLVNPDGFDLFVQMTNGCSGSGANDHFWVFFSANTNVEYTLTVTDTATNQSRTYENPLGGPAEAITDTSAFATCP